MDAKGSAKKQAKKSKASEAAASLTKVSCCDETFFSIQCDVSLLFSLSAKAGRWAHGFQRSLALPDNVDTAQITASHNNGLLSIKIPKVKNPGPPARHITIG